MDTSHGDLHAFLWASRAKLDKYDLFVAAKSISNRSFREI
jgi:hypothetical protein